MGSELAQLAGTEWTGTGELWLDPLGNEGESYACSLSVEAGRVRYEWQHEGKKASAGRVPAERLGRRNLVGQLAPARADRVPADRQRPGPVRVRVPLPGC